MAGFAQTLLNRLRGKPTHVRRLDAAGGGRRAVGMASFGNINAEMSAAGMVAQRAAHQYANEPNVANGVNNKVVATIGTGPRATPKHPDKAIRDQLTADFDRWSEDCDAEGRTNLAGILTTAVREQQVAGEAFILIEDEGLRVLPADQCDRSMTRNLDNGETDVQGVRFDAAGGRLGYSIHPTKDQFGAWAAPVFVPADQVLHLAETIAPGQVRGLSALASIVLSAGEFAKLKDALLMQASVAAMFAGFITDENDISGGDDPWIGEEHPSLEPGTLVRLRGGQKVVFANPQAANDTGTFMKANLHALASGLGVPTHLLDNDLSGANYSSLRAGLIPFRARIEAYQYSVLVPQVLRPIWQHFVRLQVLNGNLAPEEFAPACAVEWIMPRHAQVDPAKDVEAVREMIAAGLMSRRQAVAELGWSVEDLDTEIAADREREAGLGLSFSAPEVK
ncbi:phage portal protein [Aureimonas glaciei]|uniref:Phage portal protein n=1 Tax=Aureimonas glaciei TaxID=1776957 RepID=A0A916XUI4_9HYPH|nr:phage portal protein [Aureimonas glaciei]GGD12041.1 hypothetical protein GCM10011335_13690 [Aureimonas glaciei]